MAAPLMPLHVIVPGAGTAGIGNSPRRGCGASRAPSPDDRRYFTACERQVSTVVAGRSRAYIQTMRRVQSIDDHTASAPRRTSVVLANDHPGLRRSLRSLLEREDDVDVVAEVSDYQAALHEVAIDHPDVLVLDLRMPDGFSANRIERLRAVSAGTEIVVTTMLMNEALANEALKAGAIGFVVADSADRELVEAVRRARRGLPFMSPRVRRAVA